MLPVVPFFHKYSNFIGRFFVSVLFLYAAIGQILGFTGAVALMASIHLPMPAVLLTLGILMEFFGGLGLLIGFKTKWAALTLAFFTFLTIVIFHSNIADQTAVILALKNFAIIGGLLMYAVHGGGALSIDNRRKKKVEVDLPPTPPRREPIRMRV